MDVEEKAIITQEFQDITNNDMHVIEAIGMGTPKTCHRLQRTLCHGRHPDDRDEQPGKKGM